MNETVKIVVNEDISKLVIDGKEFNTIIIEKIIPLSNSPGLLDLLGLVGIKDSRQLDVVMYILDQTNLDTFLFIGTYNKIIKELNISTDSVRFTMKKLQASNLIKLVRNGLWRVNPILFKPSFDSLLVKYSDFKDE